MTRALIKGVFVLLLLGCHAVSLKAANQFYVEAPPALILDTWTGSGAVSGSTFSCISSSNTNAESGFTSSDETYPYWVKVDSSLAVGSYNLYLNGDTSQEALSISISHRDTLAGTAYEALIPDTFESHAHIGQFPGCLSNGTNSEFYIEVAESDLSNASNGNYSGTFRITGQGGTNNSKRSNADFDVEVTIDSGQLVKISNLDDVSLGVYQGTGDISVNETFCVYSSEGGYRFSMSSASQNESGEFFLPNVADSSLMPLSLTFSDSIISSGETAVTNLPISGIGDSASADCGGLDNATITFTASEAALQSASSGDYLETFYLLVEPE